MAQNLASKYSKKVAERFYQESFSKIGTNDDYDFDGVATVYVYSVNTVPTTTYQRDGYNRYGAPNELGTTKQALTLANDKAFSTTIDRRNRDESQGVTEAGAFLARQLKEVVTPEIDAYVLSVMTTAATANSKALNTGATNTSNAYSDFLALQTSLSNDSVPLTGRVAFMTNDYYALLKRSDLVLASEDYAGKRQDGDYGTVDGVKIKVVPSSYMTSNANLILCHPSATVMAMELTSYITHQDPPGINGWLVEGRFVYDAFVLDAKNDAIAVHKTA